LIRLTSSSLKFASNNWEDTMTATVSKKRPSPISPERNVAPPREISVPREMSVYAVLLSSVGRQRFCTPLRSVLAGGDES
jgi:hypothetical protein